MAFSRFAAIRLQVADWAHAMTVPMGPWPPRFRPPPDAYIDPLFLRERVDIRLDWDFVLSHVVFVINGLMGGVWFLGYLSDGRLRYAV